MEDADELRNELADMKARFNALVGKLIEAHESMVAMNQTIGVIATSTVAAFEMVGMLAGDRREAISKRMEEIEEEMLAAAAPDSALELLARCRTAIETAQR